VGYLGNWELEIGDWRLEVGDWKQHHALNGVISVSSILDLRLSVGIVGYLWDMWDTCGILTGLYSI
jgi:hypothetical protein